MEEVNKILEQDMFTEDGFVYYKTISVANKYDPKITTQYTFGLKEITGSEEDRISKYAMKLDAKKGSVEIDQEEANVRYLMAVLVKAPFQVTYMNIKRLSKKIRDELIEYAKQINTVSSETEKKSDGLSEDII